MAKVIRIHKDKNAQADINAMLNKAIDALPDGNYILVIQKPGQVRTNGQNKLFWMWMAQLEYLTGTPRKVWHDHYISLFVPPTRHGTSDLSTEAMQHLMNQIHADALVEWGIDLPLPDDSDKYYDFVDEFKFK